MTTNVYTIKQGDQLPAFEATIAFRDAAKDITATIGLATPVVLILRSASDPTATPIVDREAAAVTDVGTKAVTVTRQWQAGETAVAGTYHAELEFDIGGLAYTAPTIDHITVEIVNDLD